MTVLKYQKAKDKMKIRLPVFRTFAAQIGEITLSAGWYPGEHFHLFRFDLFEVFDDDAPWAINIFSIQIAKLDITISYR